MHISRKYLRVLHSVSGDAVLYSDTLIVDRTKLSCPRPPNALMQTQTGGVLGVVPSAAV